VSLSWLLAIPGILGSLFGGGGPQYRSPADLGIPPNSPLWQYLTTGILPGSDQPVTTNTWGSSVTDAISNTLTNVTGWRDTEPYYLPQAQPLANTLPKILQARVAQGGKVQPAEKAGVYKAIGRQADTLQRALDSRLIETGMYGSEPIRAAVNASVGQGRLASTSDYLSRIPQIERDRYMQEIGGVSNVLKALYQGTRERYGSTTKSTTNSHSTTASRSTSETTKPGGVFDPSVLSILLGQSPSIFDRLGGLSNLLLFLQAAGAFGGDDKDSDDN
jgi:hypothetical protein